MCCLLFRAGTNSHHGSGNLQGSQLLNRTYAQCEIFNIHSHWGLGRYLTSELVPLSPATRIQCRKFPASLESQQNELRVVGGWRTPAVFRLMSQVLIQKENRFNVTL
ncbi:hypothetical protein V2G26_008792 [Clonostachys chloroleuca]